jgi:hypothetical protein
LSRQQYEVVVMRSFVLSRICGLAASSAMLLAAVATPVLAAAPSVTEVSFHRDGALLDCPGFTLFAEWDITRRITLFSDVTGTPTSDIFHVEFNGSIYNPANGKSVPDSGVRIFHDQLAPDGSYLSTILTFQRTDPYVHEAGQIKLGASDASGEQAFVRRMGVEGFTDANVAALCAALGGD